MNLNKKKAKHVPVKPNQYWKDCVEGTRANVVCSVLSQDD